MSSTSSEHTQPDREERSPSESLASRYRHLFVLPSKGLLLAYAAALSVLLSLASGRGALNLPSIITLFLVVVFVSAVIASATKLADPGTIATFRRSTAAIFAGDVIWLFCLVCGLVYSFAVGNSHPLSGALVFGAFVCGGFEFIVINGAFTTVTSVSLPLAALHPLLTVFALEFTGTLTSVSYYAVVFGFAGSAALILFIVALKRRRIDKRHDALGMFQAFMKTWAGKNSADLEEIAASQAEKADISTKVLRFHQSSGDTFVVLPGVHPGPFYPVGSYNLPSLMYQRFSGNAQVLTLHGPGGHERNLATTSDTLKFVSEVYEFAQSVQLTSSPALLRGPIISRIGLATVSSFALESDAVVTVSFAPLGSEDLETEVENELRRMLQPSGFLVSVVDAHNSIEPKPESLDIHAPGWKDFFERLGAAKPMELKIACVNSHELGFGNRRDVAAGGLCLLLLDTGGRKWALALADSNNAAPSVKGVVAGALEAFGYNLLEFCTTDSHELAARGMTLNRGYFALGEATPSAEIAKITVELAKLADSRLASCEYGSGTLVRSLNTWGTRALAEFERITESSVRFARRYSIYSTAWILLLLALTLAL